MGRADIDLQQCLTVGRIDDLHVHLWLDRGEVRLSTDVPYRLQGADGFADETLDLVRLQCVVDGHEICEKVSIAGKARHDGHLPDIAIEGDS